MVTRLCKVSFEDKEAEELLEKIRNLTHELEDAIFKFRALGLKLDVDLKEK